MHDTPSRTWDTGMRWTRIRRAFHAAIEDQHYNDGGQGPHVAWPLHAASAAGDLAVAARAARSWMRRPAQAIDHRGEWRAGSSEPSLGRLDAADLQIAGIPRRYAAGGVGAEGEPEPVALA